MRNRIAINITLTLLSIIVALFIGEISLRAIGNKPWINYNTDVDEPTMYEAHPILGWQNKKGNYIVPPYHSSGEPIQFTFLDGGERRTSNELTNNAADQLILVGGSYTQGWAINDHETYAWKLQEEYPLLNVSNYGTGGYGTYQSLLMLEKQLQQATSPTFVIYGFMWQHATRNVASSDWLNMLSTFSELLSNLVFGPLNQAAT